MNFKVSFWALPNTVVEGKVREIAPMADPVTRTFKVRVSLLNLPPEVKLGMTATVNMANSTTSKAFKIPITAIYQNSETPAVWVVAGDTVALRPIKTGQYSTESTIEVLEGLQPGECIVTKGVHKLKQGQKVKVGEAL
jgi:RND family efflux transporter MFP subunit